MYIVYLFFVILITFFLRINHKRQVKLLEYKEWMETRGFTKVELFLYDQNEFEYQDSCIITTTHLIGYIHSGILNFVFGKNCFCNFEFFPEKPSNYEDVKKTTSTSLNTGVVKSCITIK